MVLHLSFLLQKSDGEWLLVVEATPAFRSLFFTLGCRHHHAFSVSWPEHCFLKLDSRQVPYHHAVPRIHVTDSFHHSISQLLLGAHYVQSTRLSILNGCKIGWMVVLRQCLMHPRLVSSLLSNLELLVLKPVK